MQYPAYSFSQGKDTGPAPHKGPAGAAAAPRGGGAREARTKQGPAARRAALPLLWFGWRGGRRPPGRQTPPPPPRDAAVSCYPTGSPPYFPSVTHHTPKAFWKPPKAVSKAEPFAALGEAPLTPFASPGAAHAPSAPHFRPATSQGSGGGAAPSRGPGARPPLAVAEPISISASAPAFLSDLAQTLLLRHEKGPAGAEPFDLLFCFVYSMMLDTTPEATVRPPSRIANRRPSSMAMGVIRVISIRMLSPGITISTPSGSLMVPVTSVVRK